MSAFDPKQTWAFENRCSAKWRTHFARSDDLRKLPQMQKPFTESRTRSFRRRCRGVPPAALMGASSAFEGFLLCLDLLLPVGSRRLRASMQGPALGRRY